MLVICFVCEGREYMIKRCICFRDVLLDSFYRRDESMVDGVLFFLVGFLGLCCLNFARAIDFELSLTDQDV